MTYRDVCNAMILALYGFVICRIKNLFMKSFPVDRTRLFLLSILSLAAILRLWSFSGIQGSDDVAIARLALELMNDGPHLPMSHYAARIGLYYPLALIYTLFGVGEWQTVIMPMAYSLLGVWLAYAIGKQLIGVNVGLLAALLLAVFPLDIYNASQLMPDLPMGVTAALAVYLFLRVTETDQPYRFAVAAGLVWGLSYLIKIEAAFLALPLLWRSWTHRHHWRPLLVVFLTVGLVVFIESLVYYLAGGTILHRIYCVTHQGDGVTVAEYSASQLWVFPKAWFITIYDFALHYYLLFAGIIWVLVTRRSVLYPVILWVVIDLLWLQFGGNPFSDNYHPKSHLLRYCEILAVPMAVIIGALLHGLKEQYHLSAPVHALAIGGVVFVALFFANFNTLSSERQQATKLALDQAVAHDYFPLYLDQTSANVASIYLYQDPRVAQIHSLQKHDMRTQETVLLSIDELNGYALLNRGFMLYAWRRYRMDEVSIDNASARYQTLFVANNPGNALAYRQAEFLATLARLIPVTFLREKIATTAEELLEPNDAVILRLGPATPTTDTRTSAP